MKINSALLIQQINLKDQGVLARFIQDYANKGKVLIDTLQMSELVTISNVDFINGLQINRSSFSNGIQFIKCKFSSLEFTETYTSKIFEFNGCELPAEVKLTACRLENILFKLKEMKIKATHFFLNDSPIIGHSNKLEVNYCNFSLSSGVRYEFSEVWVKSSIYFGKELTFLDRAKKIIVQDTDFTEKVNINTLAHSVSISGGQWHDNFHLISSNVTTSEVRLRPNKILGNLITISIQNGKIFYLRANESTAKSLEVNIEKCVLVSIGNFKNKLQNYRFFLNEINELNIQSIKGKALLIDDRHPSGKIGAIKVRKSEFDFISVKGVMFASETIFEECTANEFNANNAKFLDALYFKNCVFKSPPKFHATEIHHDTQFINCRFPSPKKEDEDIYRILKFQMGKIQNTIAENLFASYELEAGWKKLNFKNALYVKSLGLFYLITNRFGRWIWLPVFWQFFIFLIGAIFYYRDGGVLFESGSFKAIGWKAEVAHWSALKKSLIYSAINSSGPLKLHPSAMQFVAGDSGILAMATFHTILSTYLWILTYAGIKKRFRTE